MTKILLGIGIVAMFIYIGYLFYYKEPILQFKDEKHYLSLYEAKYDYNLVIQNGKRYYMLIKVEQIKQTKGLFVKTIKSDTLDQRLIEEND
jgi:hypothetical protein